VGTATTIIMRMGTLIISKTVMDTAITMTQWEHHHNKENILI
jgi:hypothetical protein